MQNGIRDILKGHELIPVVTFDAVDQVSPFIDYILSRNVRCIEVVLRSEAALDSIRHIRAQYGDDITLGAGTILSTEQAMQVAEAGVSFMVSPGCTSRLIDGMKQTGVAFLPGVATPSEVMQAREWGLDTLKFFPAHLYGGKDALKAYAQLFRDVVFCPTGGITADTSSEFLALPNVIAVGGSWFQKDFEALEDTNPSRGNR